LLARFTRAKAPLAYPLTVKSLGVYRDRLVSSMSKLNDVPFGKDTVPTLTKRITGGVLGPSGP